MNVRLPRVAAMLGACVLLGVSQLTLAETDLQLAVLAGSCANCHGTDGGLDGAIPPLAGRDADFLQERLLAFKHSEVPNTTIMNRLAAGFSDEELAALAEHFANQEQE